jgi:tetratricopeptide (TPR) repeat protein
MANSISAEIEVDNGNYEKALKYLEVCKDDFASKGFNYSLKAQCYAGLGKKDKARNLFEKAIEYRPNKKEIVLAYTKFLIAEKDYETANKRIKKLAEESEDIELLKSYFKTLYYLAKQGSYKYNLEKALGIAEKIAKINPEEFNYNEEKNELEELLRNYE